MRQNAVSGQHQGCHFMQRQTKQVREIRLLASPPQQAAGSCSQPWRE